MSAAILLTFGGCRTDLSHRTSLDKYKYIRYGLRYGGTMVNRRTFVNMRVESELPLVSSNIKMKSTGFRYFLLMPIAPLLLYASLIWSVLVVSSNCRVIRRIFG